MSAIARVLHERGEQVTGSDRSESTYVQALRQEGLSIAIGHHAQNVEGASLVLTSSAIPSDNVELAAAREAGIPVLTREAYLSSLIGERQTLAVAGTHGKTTTTALIAWILERSGLAPSFIVGGVLTDLGVNARADEGAHFVIEADEYDRMFLGLAPSIALVTNVEHDHPDCYPTQASFHEAFQQFVDRVRDTLILCVDDPGAMNLKPGRAALILYGLGSDALWRAEEIQANAAGGSDFLVVRQGKVQGLVRTRLPGLHNVRNVLGAIVVCDAIGVAFADIRGALAEFHGVARRFEIVATVKGVTVVSDYAHHPTEIEATLKAAAVRFPEESLWAVYQPHTYSRVKLLIDELSDVFQAANYVIVTEVFAAREEVDPSFGGKQIAERIDHPHVKFCAGLEEAADYILRGVTPGSVVVTLSAGDGDRVGELVLEGLRSQGEGDPHEYTGE